MNPAPQRSPADQATPSHYRADSADPDDAPPPHVLWAALESAYSPPVQSAPLPYEERLAPYLALPMAVGLSLVLWIIIVELVLTR